MDRDPEAVREETRRQLETVRAQREADRLHRKKIREIRESARHTLVGAQETQRLLPPTGR
jgi:hypothetical protein